MATIAFEMPTGRRRGAFKRAATLAGIPVDDYIARRAAGEKRCSTCRAWKAIDAFALSSKSWDGHCGECRECSIQSCRDARDRRRRGIPASARGVSRQRRKQLARTAVDEGDPRVALYRAERSARTNRLAPIFDAARLEYQRHLADVEVGKRGGRPKRRTA